MASVKWIKVVVDLFDNRKIRQIESLPNGDAIIVIWIKILCLAGSINEDGYLLVTKDLPYTDQMLATQFNRPATSVSYAVHTFLKFGMLEQVDSCLKVTNWERYQSTLELEKLREKGRDRQKAFRDRQKAQCNVTRNVTLTLQDRYCNATERDIDRDKEKDAKRESIERENAPTAPTLADVIAYCKSRNSIVNPNRFYEYYSSINWTKNGEPITDWQARVRSWETTEIPKKNANAHTLDRGNDYFEEIIRAEQERTNLCNHCQEEQ